MKETRSEREEWIEFLKKEPFEELEKKAEAGDADAQFNLAVCYQTGAGTRRSLKKAAFWFEQAARQEDAEALYELGFCYTDGLGVPRSQKRATACYEKAAGLGNIDAQCAMGYAYADGVGVARNEALSAYWFGRSAEGGDSEAQYNYARCFEEGEGVPKDLDKAFYWYAQAAEGGDVFARLNLAFYYMEGIAVEADEKRGFAILKQTAAQLSSDEDPEAVGACYCALAGCYEKGKGAARDLKKAERLLLKAVKTEDVYTYNALLYFYNNHREFDIDGKKVKRFLRKMARHDDTKTMLMVACGKLMDKTRKGFESMEKLFLDAVKGLPYRPEDFHEDMARVRRIAKELKRDNETETDGGR